MLMVLLCILWYISGVASFVYWWTKDYDFSASEILLAALSGGYGPIAFIIGYTIHGTNTDKKVLLKRRGG